MEMTETRSGAADDPRATPSPIADVKGASMASFAKSIGFRTI